MTDTYKTDKEIEELVSKFILKTLDKSDWTHFAHLTVAIWFLRKYDKNDAICRLRSGIISYNTATGTENTGQSGYHETLTIFWIGVLTFFLGAAPSFSLLETCNAFLKSSLADKRLPFEFYTKETLLSDSARSGFISPDKNELIEVELNHLLT